MEPKITQTGKYSVTYFNKKELRTLNEEIFKEEIYSIDLLGNKEKVRKVSKRDRNKPLNIIDAGAYIGLSTLYFKKRFPNSKISCFEPNPNVFPLLEENILCNDIKNVKLFNVALGKKPSERKLYIDNSGYGAFSTASFRKDAWNGKQKTIPIKVKTEPLSKYIKDRVDILKLDIEGCELEVLRELDEKNSFRKIQNLFIEYHPQKNQNINNVLDILKRNKFHLEFLKEGKQLKEPLEGLILIVAKK
jgi:FkbM family methyltransferase